jgi:endonuclease-3
MSSDRLARLRELLVAKGQERLSGPRKFIEFVHAVEADILLNNLEEYPHAFVIACIMDRQMAAEKAWRIPYHLKEAIGRFDFDALSRLSEPYFRKVMSGPPALHRFPEVMAKNLHSALRRIEAEYGGDASEIWAERPSSATIVRRFLEFDGVGQKIATMAANILVRDFRIPVSDRYSIDISVDVQIRRVFARMGFVAEDAPPEFIIYRARELHPEYPGIFDLVLWELGRTICLPTRPRCIECHWSELCAQQHTKSPKHLPPR